MLIWDIIRDWFVMYIFGGMASNYTVYGGGLIGHFLKTDDLSSMESTLGKTYIKVADLFNGDYGVNVSYFSLGDWLSTTATLIVIIAVCFGLFMLVRYFFRMFSGLLTLR